MPARHQPHAPPVTDVRRFNRFYTRQSGLLDSGFLDSPFSLTEVRVLYELAHLDETTATLLQHQLGIDAGYMSRILRGFHRRGLVTRTASRADARQTLLRLTRKGRSEFAVLDKRQTKEVRTMLDRLSIDEQRRLVGAMKTTARLLGSETEPAEPYTIRTHRPGDMGWVTYRHGALYHQEYGWDERFEALVGRICADFIEQLKPKRERCWIAERDGEVVGSVFCVEKSKTVAKLRLLYVEPSARGLGIGSRLVEECIRFARGAGYHTLTLWTQSLLHSARRIYEGAGFVLVAEEPHHSFGYDLVAQTWDLDLRKSMKGTRRGRARRRVE